MTYQSNIAEMNEAIRRNGESWAAIDAASAARMAVQNRFPTGLDIARYTAKIMRE
ncbi:MAG: isocitrate lyase, partial [Erythrobacter sp.]|nr:isocitrate lyase [Erythrobacter sp.]